MSESNEHFHRDFSMFDAMGTEELNEILRQDSQLPDGEDSDTDAILYIMGVIEKRSQELPASDVEDVDRAWDSFNQNYRFASSDERPLFDLDDEPQQNSTSDKMQILQPAPHSNARPHKRVLRTASTLAAVIAVLLATSLTAYALGFDLWGAIANWTKETFSFVRSESRFLNPSEAEQVLFEYGLEQPLLPSWLPQGYVYDNIDIAETPNRTVFYIKYSSVHSEILITIAKVSAAPALSVFEKDATEVVEYSAKETVYYIIENNENINIVWVTGPYECSITGHMSLEEAKEIIDSIC